MKIIFKIFLILSFCSIILSAQANGKNFGLSFNANYTTTSQLFLQPNSSDQIIRASHQSLNDIYSYSIELRFSLSETIILGLGSEIIQKTFDNTLTLSGSKLIINDGYKVIPIEISAYYLVPFSTEKFKMFMGGGAGFYLGNHIREIGDVTISNETKKAGFGIHVAVGFDYLIHEFIALRMQMRFREPEFRMESKYSDVNVNYLGKKYILPSESFSSKVDIDGVTFTFGAVIYF
jgi:hypothetical protein